MWKKVGRRGKEREEEKRKEDLRKVVRERELYKNIQDVESSQVWSSGDENGSISILKRTDRGTEWTPEQIVLPRKNKRPSLPTIANNSFAFGDELDQEVYLCNHEVTSYFENITLGN